MARTILLADDSMTIQKVVELTFMDEDYQVVAVSDGTAAIQKLSEMRPDLLIADVHMPGANGYDVCRQAKSQVEGLPVLLLVGTFEQFDEGEAQACGSDGHLKKPFDSQELLNRVESLVKGSQAAAAQASGPGASGLEPMVLPSAMPDVARVPEMPPQPSMAPVAPLAPAAPPVTAEAPQPPAAPEVSAPPVTPAATVSETADTRPMAKKTIDPAASPPASDSGGSSLSEGDVDRIARRVVELIADGVLKEVAWEVLPDLAEVVIRERIHELERQVESA